RKGRESVKATCNHQSEGCPNLQSDSIFASALLYEHQPTRAPIPHFPILAFLLHSFFLSLLASSRSPIASIPTIFLSLLASSPSPIASVPTMQKNVVLVLSTISALAESLSLFMCSYFNLLVNQRQVYFLSILTFLFHQIFLIILFVRSSSVPRDK